MCGWRFEDAIEDHLSNSETSASEFLKQSSINGLLFTDSRYGS